MVDVDGSNLPIDSQSVQVGWLGLRVGGHHRPLHRMKRVNSRNGFAKIAAVQALSLVSLDHIACTHCIDAACSYTRRTYRRTSRNFCACCP